MFSRPPSLPSGGPAPARPRRALLGRTAQIAAVLSYRQFGWRVLSHVGVDVRRQDASARLRASLAANAFTACYRFAFIFVVLVTTLGILVAAEDPGGSDPVFLTVTIVLGLISTAAITLYVFALARAAARKTVW